MTDRGRRLSVMKKLLRLGVLAGIGYWIYRTVTGKKAEADLWQEATEGSEFSEGAPFGDPEQSPDLR